MVAPCSLSWAGLGLGRRLTRQPSTTRETKLFKTPAGHHRNNCSLPLVVIQTEKENTIYFRISVSTRQCLTETTLQRSCLRSSASLGNETQLETELVPSNWWSFFFFNRNIVFMPYGSANNTFNPMDLLLAFCVSGRWLVVWFYVGFHRSGTEFCVPVASSFFFLFLTGIPVRCLHRRR